MDEQKVSRGWLHKSTAMQAAKTIAAQYDRHSIHPVSLLMHVNIVFGAYIPSSGSLLIARAIGEPHFVISLIQMSMTARMLE
jgi:hypothetical protein